MMLNGSYLTCCGKGANSILRNVPEYWYFSGNTWKCVSMATNYHGHYFVSSYSKYESLRFICHPNKNSLVFPSWRHSLCIEMDCTSMAIFSHVLRNSTPRFHQLSAGPSHSSFKHLRLFSSLLLPKCSSDPNHAPCPSASVSSLVY